MKKDNVIYMNFVSKIRFVNKHSWKEYNKIILEKKLRQKKG